MKNPSVNSIVVSKLDDASVLKIIEMSVEVTYENPSNKNPTFMPYVSPGFVRQPSGSLIDVQPSKIRAARFVQPKPAGLFGKI